MKRVSHQQLEVAFSHRQSLVRELWVEDRDFIRVTVTPMPARMGSKGLQSALSSLPPKTSSLEDSMTAKVNRIFLYISRRVHTPRNLNCLPRSRILWHISRWLWEATKAVFLGTEVISSLHTSFTRLQGTCSLLEASNSNKGGKEMSDRGMKWVLEVDTGRVEARCIGSFWGRRAVHRTLVSQQECRLLDSTRTVSQTLK